MKKKIFGITLAIALIVLMIAGTSMAYFTDVEDATNVFTSGNVDIKLTYQTKDVDGDDAIDDNNVLSLEDEGVYPGQKFEKAVTVSNIGTEKAYVGAIIKLTNENGNLASVIKPDGEDNNIPVSIRKFLVDLVANGGDYTVKYAEITNGYAIYVVKTAALAGKTTTATDSFTVFNTVKVPAEWDNAEMKTFNGFTLNVTAYATQTAGFDGNNGVATADTALTTAFGDWAGYASATALS